MAPSIIVGEDPVLLLLVKHAAFSVDRAYLLIKARVGGCLCQDYYGSLKDRHALWQKPYIPTEAHRAPPYAWYHSSASVVASWMLRLLLYHQAEARIRSFTARSSSAISLGAWIFAALSNSVDTRYFAPSRCERSPEQDQWSRLHPGRTEVPAVVRRL